MGILTVGRWRALLRPLSAAATNFLDLLVNLDTAYRGDPFVQGPTKVTTTLQPMDYAYRGGPFVPFRRAS